MFKNLAKNVVLWTLSSFKIDRVFYVGKLPQEG